MSKSLRNWPPTWAEVFTARLRRDALFLMSSPVVRGGNLIVKEESIRDTVRHAVLLPIWNTYYFFTLYGCLQQGGEGEAKRIDRLPGGRAGADGPQHCRRTRTLVEDGAFDAYDVVVRGGSRLAWMF